MISFEKKKWAFNFDGLGVAAPVGDWYISNLVC